MSEKNGTLYWGDECSSAGVYVSQDDYDSVFTDFVELEAQHARIIAAKDAEIERLKAELERCRAAQSEQPVAWMPYLSDRADGVAGHYAITRNNPAGYREVWNLRGHRWAAFSDEVLTLNEALAILKKLEIPTAPSQQQPEGCGACGDDCKGKGCRVYAESPPACDHRACKSLGEPHPFCNFVSQQQAEGE